jgi:hypothetical protein
MKQHDLGGTAQRQLSTRLSRLSTFETEGRNLLAEEGVGGDRGAIARGSDGAAWPFDFRNLGKSQRRTVTLLATITSPVVVGARREGENGSSRRNDRKPALRGAPNVP